LNVKNFSEREEDAAEFLLTGLDVFRKWLRGSTPPAMGAFSFKYIAWRMPDCELRQSSSAK